MDILPLEILTTIFEEVDDVQDLRNVRAANHTFCAAATPSAFRALTVIPTRRHARNIGRLFDLPDIAKHVIEFSYCDPGDDRTLYVRTRTTHKLVKLFARIHQLPRLQTINLSFFSGHENVHHVKVHASILGALATSFSVCTPQNLISLSLHYLRPLYISPLKSPPFQIVLSTLRRLQLCICRPSAIETVRWDYFWGTLCPRNILPPTQPALTELTLHTNGFIGASSNLSFHALHCPHLCALSLSMIIFEPSVGVEPFILRHASTLSRLELITCKLLVDRDTRTLISTSRSRSPPPSTILIWNESKREPLHWGSIWDDFTAELTALIALHVEEGRVPAPPPMRYAVPLRWGGYWPIAVESRHTADTEALRHFYMTVSSRRRRAGYPEGEAAFDTSVWDISVGQWEPDL